MPKQSYKIIRSRRRLNSTSISVSENGVVVHAPFWVPKFVVDQFVSEKDDWIKNQLSRIEKRNANKKQYIDGEKHLFFGKELSLSIIEKDTPSRTKVEINTDTIIVTLWSLHQGEKRTKEIKEALTSWYLEQGIGLITEKVNHFSKRLSVEYKEIKIKKVSTIWGSCSPTNNLSFNRKLLMAPHEIVDYVVIHEVCHMVQRNHSSHFWALVCKFDPMFRQHRRWLKTNSHLLSL